MSRVMGVLLQVLGAAAFFVLLTASSTAQEKRFIVIASTTSTDQSGLFGHVLPLFTRRTGIEARVVALGTGQALDVGRRGDADVVFVHDRTAEDEFVAKGFGIGRKDVMYNDFAIIGPKSDPAWIGGSRDAAEALRRIAVVKAAFVSRGDRSGTHMAELRLWHEAGIVLSRARGPWYRETGSGMGPALNAASAMNAYLLADRGSWLSFKNRGELTILVAGDRRFFNPYGVILVNPARHPHVHAAGGRAFIDWITGPEGQRAIADFHVAGEPLFFPDSKPGS